MHMAPSARMQLSSNSRWVTVALDWEDTKVNKDTKKPAEGDCFLSSTDTGHFLQTSESIADAE